jgi:DnaJ-class molecular chaperone
MPPIPGRPKKDAGPPPACGACLGYARTKNNEPCKACGGTGRSSRQGPCDPCAGTGKAGERKRLGSPGGKK